MAVRHLVVLLLAAASSSLATARDLKGRDLLQQTTCPVGCDVVNKGCFKDDVTGTFSCSLCLGGLQAITTAGPDLGKCGCPAGTYADLANNLPVCKDCEKGYYCPGGPTTDAVAVPGKEDCPGRADGKMTTRGSRARSPKACLNMPGYYYSASGNAVSATVCGVNTYSPGLKKQTTCVPCPAGYTTGANTGGTSIAACSVADGYFLAGPGQVAVCPKGTYRSAGDTAVCTRCQPGVSTDIQGATSEESCVELVAGFYATAVDAKGFITATAKCPQSWYCPGGKPAAPKFVAKLVDGATPVDDNMVFACPGGRWTQEMGADRVTQCMTPPGFKTVQVGNDVKTLECSATDGEYRPEWAAYDENNLNAKDCLQCGANIYSDNVDAISVYTRAGAMSYQLVKGSTGACYIRKGQGMYQSTAADGTVTYRAQTCNSNNYGVKDKTFTLGSLPCRQCPTGMETRSTAPSTTYRDALAPTGTGGYFSPEACVTQPGYAYNGRVATKCPKDSYSEGGTYGGCKKCPQGTITDNGVQSSLDSCRTRPGWSKAGAVIQECAVGTYRSGVGPANNADVSCTACPVAGTTTSGTASVSVDECKECTPGYGGAPNCGICTSGKYSPAGTCEDCGLMTSGFSFWYGGSANPYIAAPVSRDGATSSGECLASMAQIMSDAWYLPGANTLNSQVASLEACADSCTGSPDCLYIMWWYKTAAGGADASLCYRRMRIDPGLDNTVMAFKTVVAGDVSGASVNETAAAKSVTGSAYSFYKDTGGDGASFVGITMAGVTLPNANELTTKACLKLCSDRADCAAVRITGAKKYDTSLVDSCELRSGDVVEGLNKRGLVKANDKALDLATITPALPDGTPPAGK